MQASYWEKRVVKFKLVFITGFIQKIWTYNSVILQIEGIIESDLV